MSTQSSPQHADHRENQNNPASSPPSASIVSEVVAASLGGVLSASALYPLEVVKTKLQAGQPEGQAQDEDEDEDSKLFVSHKRAKCCCKGCTASRVQAKLSAPEQHPQPTLSAKPRSKSLSVVALSKAMYRQGGISAFYRGVGASAAQSAFEKGLYFFAYTWLKQVYRGRSKGQQRRVGPVVSLVLGCIAEWAHLPITLPIDCVKTRIQTNAANHANSKHGPMAVLLSLLSSQGLKGMYQGWQAYLVLCLKPAIQYTVFEQVKRLLLLQRQRGRNFNHGVKNNTLTALESFGLGMLARALATVVVFPYTRAKVMLQASAAANNRKMDEKSTAASDSTSVQPQRQASIPSILHEMLTTGGISELFRGLGPEVSRGVLSAALMMMVKEQIAALVQGIWLHRSRVRQLR